MPLLQRQGLTFEDRDGKAEIALPYLHEPHQVNIVYTLFCIQQTAAFSCLGFLGIGARRIELFEIREINYHCKYTSFNDFRSIYNRFRRRNPYNLLLVSMD